MKHRYNFENAATLIERGHSMRRCAWPSGKKVRFREGVMMLVSTGNFDKVYSPSFDDIRAADWEVADAPSAYGWWKVSAQGVDRDTALGTHFGFIDDIAFALSAKQEYGLTFEAIPPNEIPRISDKVNIRPVKVFGEEIPLHQILADRPVVVGPHGNSITRKDQA